MFYHLKGTVVHMEPYLAVLDVQGVGFACHTSLTTQGRLKVGEGATLYTHLHVREGILDLYGFAGREELSAFRMLLGISGVGPRAALSILSVTTPERLAVSVLQGDEKTLTAAVGVGKKLSQRIVLELRDKLGRQFGSDTPGVAYSSADAPHPDTGKWGEAQAALTVLGYSPAEAAYALKDIDIEALTVEEIIRAALKKMV